MTVSRSRTRLNPETRRALIIEVATRQIAEGGFNTFTLSRLAEECEMTRRGVTHYFASRDDILVAVLEHRDDVDSAAVATVGLDAHTEPELWALMDAFIARNVGQPEILRLYTVLGAEALDPSHPAHEYFTRRTALAQREISRMTRSWHPDPDVLALEVLARVEGLQLLWLRDPSFDLLAQWRAIRSSLRTDGPVAAQRN